MAIDKITQENGLTDDFFEHPSYGSHGGIGCLCFARGYVVNLRNIYRYINSRLLRKPSDDILYKYLFMSKARTQSGK